MSAEWLREITRRLAGRRVPGGCGECNAYQTMDEDADHPDFFHLHIHHDDWCPFLARITAIMSERVTTHLRVKSRLLV